MDTNLYPVMRECAIYNAGDKEMFYSYTYEQYLNERDNTMLFSLVMTRNEQLIQRYFHLQNFPG